MSSTRCYLVLGLLIAATVVTHSECADFTTLDHIVPSASEDVQRSAAEGLIQRLVGARASDFTVTIDTNIGPKNRDTFKLETSGGHVHITGTSGLAAGWGFHYFLSEYCGGHVSWAGDQPHLPTTLPQLPSGGVTVTSNDKFRYYQNVCTVSYSFAWWNWSRWEREIDWMAMNGYNLALAFQGQEEIWRRVYTQFGFTQAEIDGHLGGPAFFSWSRMGNDRGWGGPIPASWHAQQVAMQHNILARMRAFGMTPVTPAFAGHVPRGVTRVFPGAKVTQAPNWGAFTPNYCCVNLLDFEDPAFTKIGKAFLTEYTKEFGTDHVYNTDTFNEMAPKSSEPSYLQSAGKAVFNSLLSADNQAIWLMQGWLFTDEGFWKPPQAQALLTSVPLGRMIVLDLWSEVRPQYTRLSSYFGQPYIWCMLHNFGGTISMYGVIETLNKEPFVARAAANSTMVGTGLTPEGINQNDVIYAFMNENSWRKQPRNLTQWMSSYATRRYGRQSQYADAAWQILKSSAYNASGGEGADGIVAARPHISSLPDVQIWYDPNDMYKAWDSMLQAAPALTGSALYRYDLVDVSRQSLQVLSTLYYNNMILAYRSKNTKDFSEWSQGLLTLLSDFDTLLGSDAHFLLGRWLEDAKALGTNTTEKVKYEYNARKQITVWGTSSTSLVDYANKQWSGLVRVYYTERWKLFIDQLADSLSGKQPYNDTRYQQDVYCQVENPFTEDRTPFPATPSGDQIDLAQKLHTKYRPMTRKYSLYFSELPRASAAGRKFTGHMTRWLRRYRKNDTTRTDEIPECNQTKRKLRHNRRPNMSIIKDDLPIKL